MTTRPIPADPDTWVAWAWVLARPGFSARAVLVHTGSVWWWTTPVTPARYALAGQPVAYPRRRARLERRAWSAILARTGWREDRITTDDRQRAIACVLAVPSASAPPVAWWRRLLAAL